MRTKKAVAREVPLADVIAKSERFWQKKTQENINFMAEIDNLTKRLEERLAKRQHS